MADATRELDIILKLKDRASKDLKGFRGQIDKMQPAFAKFAVGGGVALASIGAGLKTALGNAVELGESINAVEVVFQDGSDAIKEFGKTAATSVGMSNAAFNQLATMTGALLTDVGKPMDEVSQMTIELAKRAADLASVYNTDVNDAMSAINQALRGETEGIRRYAADVTDASLQQFAMAQGIKKSVTEMTFQEKKLLRFKKIMADTAVVQDDFKNTSDSLANQQRILSAQWTNLTAKIGNNLIPMVQKLLAVVQPYIEKITNWINNNSALATNIALVTAGVAALTVAIGLLGMVAGPIITVIGALFSPVGAIILGIVAVVALLAVAWKKDFGGIQEKTRQVFESFKVFYDSFVVPLWEQMKKNFEENRAYFEAIWESIKLIFSGAWQAIIGMFKILWAVFSGIFKVLFAVFAGDWGKAWEVIKETFVKVWDGIKDVFIGVWDAIKGVFKLAINFIIGGINQIIKAVNKIKLPKFAGGGKLNISTLPQLATGTNYVPQDMVAQLHKGEAVVPKEYNTGKMGKNVTININGGTYLSENAGQQLAELLNQHLSFNQRMV